MRNSFRFFLIVTMDWKFASAASYQVYINFGHWNRHVSGLRDQASSTFCGKIN